MIEIKGFVERTDLCLSRPLEPLTSGCKNSIFLRLCFSRFWQSYGDRYVEFWARGGERFSAPVSADGVCVFPEAALDHGGTVYLSVIGERRGSNGEVEARVVTELSPIHVTAGGYSPHGEAV